MKDFCNPDRVKPAAFASAIMDRLHTGLLRLKSERQELSHHHWNNGHERKSLMLNNVESLGQWPEKDTVNRKRRRSEKQPGCTLKMLARELEAVSARDVTIRTCTG